MELILGSILRGLGASWALLKVSWRVFLPLLERLGRVLTTNWKKTRFLQSRKRFFNLFDAFETLKFDVSPRREPYFSKKNTFLLFLVFCVVLGLSWGPCWPHFGGLGGVLEASWAILGLVKAGLARSGQVRSGQVRSRWPGGLPRSGSEARSGQGGVPPSYKDGSSPLARLGSLQEDCTALQGVIS